MAITYRSDREAAEAVAAAVTAAGGHGLALPCDLEDALSMAGAVEATVARWGRLDLLVANAVAWPRGVDGRPWDWRRTIHANLEGTYATVQAAIPHLRRSHGRIVLVSSNLAEDGLPGSSAYASAKAALHGLAATLAVELGPDGVLSIVVMPGLTLTERAQRTVPTDVLEQIAAQTPTRRLSTPQDVAATILYLGSPRNGDINAETIRVTGGS